MSSPPVYDNRPPNGAPPNAAPYGAPYGQGQMQGPVIYVGGVQQPYQYRSGPRVYENYLNRQSLGLGVTMIVCGILCIIFNAVAIAMWSSLSIIAYGIWGGIWFIITGSFGVSAARWKTTCKIVTFMVLSIISSCICLVLVILAPISAAITSYSGSSYYYTVCTSYYYRNGNSYYTSNASSSQCQTAIAMESLQAILALIVGITSIWGAVICCKAACCCNNNNGQVLAPAQFVQGNQQVVFYAQQQQQQGGQYYPPPGSYPAQMFPGYPAPMMPNAENGVQNVGHSGTAPPHYESLKTSDVNMK